MVKALEEAYPYAVHALAMERLRQLAGPELAQRLSDLVREEPAEGENAIGHREFRQLERYWLLSSVDKAWMQHLLNIDDLRDGISLRAHGQRDPLIEYQREASQLFEELLATIAQRTTQKAFSGTEGVEMHAAAIRDLREQRTEAAVGARSSRPKGGNGNDVGRNDPCPCGSGKKYKYCCMRD